MTRKCVIEGCESKSKTPQHRGVTFHSFPFDSKTREVWISNCRINPEKNITKSVLVCSRHFRRADFQPVKGSKFLLKQGTVPTIFPWGKEDNAQIEDNLNLLTTERPASALGESTLSIDDTNCTLEGDVFNNPVKRAAETEADGAPSAKLPRLSGSYDVGALQQTPSTSGSEMQSPSRGQVGGTIGSPPGFQKGDSNQIGFTPGIRLEAQDFDGVWHTARVVEVDNDEREVLIRFERSAKSKVSSGVEEWIPMNSSRLRQKVVASTSAKSFALGEKCLARWSGSRRFPATVSKILDNDSYEVLFDDGYVKIVKGNHMSKMRSAPEKKNSSASKSKSNLKDEWPLISINSLNLDELNLPVIPKDGEWCCHWVNDQPIGQEGFLTVGDHKKATVIVEDWRLPPNWTKHMYQRSNVLGKWDVILVNPQGKRFRSKADLKLFMEDLGQVYNPDVYDFSIHRRRAKDIGAYVYTKDYKLPSAQATETATATAAATTAAVSTPQLVSPPPQAVEIAPPAVDAAVIKEVTPLEDGYVYVGSLKVQLVDNLFKCPQEGCNKTFRKENHLQIHIKHYHDEIAKLLGVCPNMQDLACKRTIGIPAEEPLPKNHLTNAQFFAKLHQQDLQLRTHRKTTSAGTLSGPQSPVVTSPIGALARNVAMSEDITSADDSTSVIQPMNLDEQVVQDVVEMQPISDDKIPTSPPTSVGLHTVEDVATPQATKLTGKTKATTGSHRKSSRQKITKKYLNASAFDSSFGIDLEDTRHSFNATPEQKTTVKRTKQQHTPQQQQPQQQPQQQAVQPQTFVSSAIAGDSNQDANSHTTGSIPETSQSPKYIQENGELIKIVRMKQEEIINCLCSYGEEDGLMIQCELCLCWQHGICNGIEKESQVPDKYVCYICRNPQRGRASSKYIHDQDWLYDGKLPIANYHAPPPDIESRFELLKRSHTLTGNLLELKKFLHSLRVKINIAENKDHPKMYLWAKKWEMSKEGRSGEIKPEKSTGGDGDGVPPKEEGDKAEGQQVKEEVKVECASAEQADAMGFNQPTVPQPEAAIDSVECQHRLLEHIQKQQTCVMDRLQEIEAEIMELESADNANTDPEDTSKAKETLAMLIKDLEVMRNLSKINTVQPTFVAY